MNKILIFGHPPKGEAVMRALEEAREALANGGLPSRVLPTPEGDYRQWSPGMTRAAALVAGHLWGLFRLDPRNAVEASLFDRILELTEELGLGPWVREIPRVRSLLVPGPKNPAPKEAAREILLGRRVASQEARDEDYLLEVAYWVHRLGAFQAIRERVAALVTASPRATVTPNDTAVIMGRVRSGKKVRVRATPEELEALRDQVAKALFKEEKRYLSPEWRWEGNGVHPRVKLALERIRLLLEEEEDQDPEPEWEEATSAHIPLLKPEEELILLGLGYEVEGRTRTLKTLEGLVADLEARLEEEVDPQVELSHLYPDDLQLLEEHLPLEGSQAHVADLLPILRRALYRLQPRRKQDPVRQNLLRFLRRYRPLSQKRIRDLLRQKNSEAARKHLALEASIGALEVLLQHRPLWDDALALAYELGLEAVNDMRSPNHHPAAYAARKARDRSAFYLELRRGGGIGLDPSTATVLFRLRKAYRQNPQASLKTLARRAGVPEEWAEEAYPLLSPVGHLEDPIGQEGLTLGDTVEAASDPVEEVEEKLLLEEALRALEALDDYLQEAVRLVVMQALPIPDVAAALEVPEEEVAARVDLGLNQLRARLGAWA